MKLKVVGVVVPYQDIWLVDKQKFPMFKPNEHIVAVLQSTKQSDGDWTLMLLVAET